MSPSTDPGHDPRHQATLPLALLFLLLFLSPLTHFWMGGGGPWYLPYLLWLLVILAGLWVSARGGRHDL
jgi:hypothetical protein